MPPIPRRSAALLAAAVLGLSACGSDGGSDGTASGDAAAATVPGDTEPSPPPAVPSDLPAVEVVDVVTGESLVLTELAPSDRPTLLWFWAPH